MLFTTGARRGDDFATRGEQMAKVLYTAEAHVTGGRLDGHGRTSDGNLEVDIRIPTELGGPGQGTNPEQLFAIGFASCFESALQTVGRRTKEEVDDVEVESKVMLMPTEERGFKIGVALDVKLPSISDSEKAADLVRTAHRVCPYSNATRGNIDVMLTANGKAVA
jgi:Ohr subfamily peroxiredoxin